MKKNVISALSGLALLVSTNSCATSSKIERKIHQSYASCIDNRYDNDRKCLEDSLTALYMSVYELETEIIYKPKKLEKEIIIPGNVGSGLLLESGYVLTVYHLNHPKNLLDEAKDIEGLATRVYIKLRDNKRYLLEEIKGDKDLDFSVMKAKEDLPTTPYYKHGIGNSNDLHVGNTIYLVGNALSQGPNLREGVVSQLFVDYKKNLNVVLFGLSNGGNFGDSGGPVVALRDGKIELVGMLIQVAPDLSANDLAWAVSINVILDKLKELGNNTPLQR